MKLTTKSFVNLLVLGAATGVLWAQSEANLSLNLKVLTAQIGPVDPLRFEIEVSNRSDNPLGGMPVFAIEDNSSVEIMSPGSNEWKSIAVPYLERLKNRCIDLDQFRFELKSREKQSYEMWVVYDPYISYQQGRPHYYFEQAGEYRLRFSYQPAPGQTLYSNDARFTVKPYEGVDQEAYNFLKTKSLPHFVYDLETYVVMDLREADDWAQELSDRFPKSRFAPYAQLYLANCYLMGIRAGNEILPPNVSEAERLASGLTNAPDERIRRMAETLMQAISQKRAALEEDAQAR